MRSTVPLTVLAVLGLLSNPSAQADTFGSGANTFTIDFVNIGNAGNAGDIPRPTTRYGAVLYEYRTGVFEISQNDITRAVANGLDNVTAGAWTGNRPAANINWYEAAAFVNWLNISTGKQAAYNLSWNGTGWSMALWSTGNAWTVGGTNLFRHKNAHYFLPSENEWYKAAYYSPSGSNYFLYATGSDSSPTAVGNGTNSGTAVYDQLFRQGPASVGEAGGLSPYGTMGQNGNILEWTESNFVSPNNNPAGSRVLRGGQWSGGGIDISNRFTGGPADGLENVGFRVAAVPEPSTYALLILAGAGAALIAKRRVGRE